MWGEQRGIFCVSMVFWWGQVRRALNGDSWRLYWPIIYVEAIVSDAGSAKIVTSHGRVFILNKMSLPVVSINVDYESEKGAYKFNICASIGLQCRC